MFDSRASEGHALQTRGALRDRRRVGARLVRRSGRAQEATTRDAAIVRYGRRPPAAELDEQAFPRETTEELVRPWTLPPLSLSPEDPGAKVAAPIENTPIPDYVDKSSLKERERGFEVTVDPTSRRRAQEARKQSLQDGVLKVVQSPRSNLSPSSRSAGSLPYCCSAWASSSCS